MPKFRKKPVVIDAFQWTGGPDQKHDPEWFIEAMRKPWGHPGAVRVINEGAPDAHLKIFTLEGTHIASQGDFIIRGIDGELYPCKSDIFNKTYEPAD